MHLSFESGLVRNTVSLQHLMAICSSFLLLCPLTM